MAHNGEKQARGKVGVFLCKGGDGGGGGESLDYKRLRWTAEAGGARVIEIAQACQAEGAAALTRAVGQHGLDRLILGACALAGQPAVLGLALDRAGLPREQAVVLDLCKKPEGAGEGLCSVCQGAASDLGQALAALEHQPQGQTETVRVSTDVLVVGDGLLALKAARDLDRAGYGVLLLTPGKRLAPPAPLLGREAADQAAELAKEIEQAGRVTVIRQGELLTMSGGAGDFKAVLVDREGVSYGCRLGAVLMCQGPPTALNLGRTGLEPAPRVVGLDQLDLFLGSPEHLKKRFGEGPLRLAVLVGLGRQADPLAMRAASLAARRMIAEHGGQAVLFTNSAKVAAPDLEELTQAVRGEGVIFVKFTTGGLSGHETGNSVDLAYDEEILGRRVEETFDLVAVDQTPAPDAAYARLAAKLGLAVQPDGSLQPDQVSALPGHSARAGVFLLGAARGSSDLDRRLDELGEALFEVRGLLAKGEVTAPVGRVKVDRKRCTICLTCVRVCPRQAMGRLDRRPIPNPLACTACGTCAAECPMEAIQVVGADDDRYEAEIAAAVDPQAEAAATAGPELVVFACTNSAAEALRAARLSGAQWPGGVHLVEVPCAGKVDPDMALTAVRRGADGVLVLACHRDACYSLTGSIWAGWRTEHLARLLAEAGWQPERIMTAGVAPSQAGKALDEVRRALDNLERLGPSPLRTGALVRQFLGRFTVPMDETYAIVA